MQKEESIFKMTKKHHTETFLQAKKDGKMDLDFVPLCDYIASTKNYFTSSCCAGRIVLVSLNEDESKKESAFYRKWHRTVTPDEVEAGIIAFDGELLWFKQESFILHIGANTLSNATKILSAMESVGIKRAGIKVAKAGKYIVEAIGTQNMTLPVKEKGDTKINREYLEYLVKMANKKFKKNQETIKAFEIEARKVLK